MVDTTQVAEAYGPPDIVDPSKSESTNKHDLTRILNDLLKKQLHKVIAASSHNEEVTKIKKSLANLDK